MSTTPYQHAAEQLILARLLVANKKPPELGAIKEQLAKFFTRLGKSESNKVIEAAFECLISSGLVRKKPLALTDEGRNQSMRFWDIDKVPDTKNPWETLKRLYIVPKVLGLQRDQIKGKDKAKPEVILTAFIKEKHGLPADAITSSQVLNAISWQRLGMISSKSFTAKEVVTRLVLKSESKSKVTPEQLVKKLAKAELGSIGVRDDLLNVAISNWIVEDASDATITATQKVEAHEPNETHPMSPNGLLDFARQTLLAAEHSRTGWFGENKVFVSHAWKQLIAVPEFSGMALDDFKDRLLDAHRHHLLELSRADLVERMDPNDVAASEIEYLNARFHFVRVH